jgi:hypothetical protein
MTTTAVATIASRTVSVRPPHVCAVDPLRRRRAGSPSLEESLADLGRRVAEDGPAAYDDELVRLARAAVGVAPAAATVLADSTAPAVVRQRALAVASAAICR